MGLAQFDDEENAINGASDFDRGRLFESETVLKMGTKSFDGID